MYFCVCCCDVLCCYALLRCDVLWWTTCCCLLCFLLWAVWWLWASELWCGVVWCMFVVLDQCSLLCCVLLCCVQAGLTKELLFNKSTTQARMATSLQIIYSLAGCIRNSEYLAVPFNSIHTIIENLAHSLMNPTLRCVATYCMSRHVWSTGPSSTKPQYPPELQNRHTLPPRTLSASTEA